MPLISGIIKQKTSILNFIAIAIKLSIEGNKRKRKINS